MRASEVFNRSWLSRFLNQPAGRLFRFTAGMGFLTYGFTHRDTRSGKLALGWGPFPFTAGAFDVCFFSAMLGGPLSGEKVRTFQRSAFSPTATAGALRSEPMKRTGPARGVQSAHASSKRRHVPPPAGPSHKP